MQSAGEKCANYISSKVSKNKELLVICDWLLGKTKKMSHLRATIHYPRSFSAFLRDLGALAVNLSLLTS